MGFRPEPTVYKLNFEGTPLDGLHIRIGCCTLREFNDMTEGASDPDEQDVSERNRRVTELFFRYLKEWDLESPDGSPTPMTPEGLDDHEPGLIRALVSAWQIAMVTVPFPLPRQSPNGGISEEQSLGLAASSESL